MRSFPP